jgi:hypothetical protein
MPTANETMIMGGPGYCDQMLTVPLDTNLVNHRAIFVGGAGDLVVLDKYGHTVTLAGVGAGALLPISVTQVKSAGTTATKLVLWL